MAKLSLLDTCRCMVENIKWFSNLDAQEQRRLQQVGTSSCPSQALTPPHPRSNLYEATSIKDPHDTDPHDTDHMTLLSSCCYHWGSGTGARELWPPASRTSSPQLPGSWMGQQVRISLLLVHRTIKHSFTIHTHTSSKILLLNLTNWAPGTDPGYSQLQLNKMKLTHLP